MDRSALNVCVMNVFMFTSRRYGLAPDTTRVEITTPSLSGIGTGTVCVKVCVVPLHELSAHEHSPFTHVSFCVHGLPSSHGSVLFMCVQPDVGLHPSSVQGLLSLQSTGVPTHIPPLHVSFIVHALL